MVQVTSGMLRFAVKDANGNVRASTEAVPLVIADNTTSPRLVLTDSLTGRPRGTINDEIIDADPNLTARAKYGEYLDIEVMVGTAFTLDTSDQTANLNVADVWEIAGGFKVEDKPLRLADRSTRTISGTFLDPRGLEDDLYVPANVWAPVARFIPPAGHTYVPRGYQEVQVHDSA